MKVWKSFFSGIKDAVLRPKMVFVLWLVNFLFASVLYFLVSGFLTDVLSRSGIAESLIKKGDFNVILDILTHHGGQAGTIFSVAIILFFLYILASLFLRGGILFSLAESLPSSTEKNKERFASIFFRGAGRFFGRFFRLMIYSLILWAGFVLINAIFHFLVGIVTSSGDNERMIFYMFWARLVVFFFFYFFVLMVLDYARIKIVLENSKKVFQNMFWALGFVQNKIGRTLGLYYLLVITGVLITIAYWLLDSFISRHTMVMVLAAFVLGQIFILARSWLTIGFQAAQMRFLDSGRQLPKETGG
ncbi:MAG: hypothetical protein JXB26_02095 [Candidatus Aminicenantes bacterium]|nr:hypothetical protein [Candidatus Aminicenantes bacterium]